MKNNAVVYIIALSMQPLSSGFSDNEFCQLRACQWKQLPLCVVLSSADYAGPERVWEVGLAIHRHHQQTEPAALLICEIASHFPAH